MAAGLPFWDPESITFTIVERIPGLDIPLAIQPFGLMVALGVVVGAHLMRRWGDKNGLVDDHVRGMILWAVVWGFIGAHVFDVVAYEPHKLAKDPLILFKLWEGISSYGGVIGGTLAVIFYARRHKLPLWRYGDGSLIAFVSGLTFGRLGCTLVHDHVGAASDGFFLAVDYPLGTIPGQPGVSGLHHNLGFYEFLFLVLMCGMLYGINRWKSRPVGLMVAASATAYAPVRFILDFLRVNPKADPRYLGLTFAQWASIAATIAGLWIIVRLLRGKPLPSPDTGTAASADASAASTGKSKGKGKGKKTRTGAASPTGSKKTSSKKTSSKKTSSKKTSSKKTGDKKASESKTGDRTDGESQANDKSSAAKSGGKPSKGKSGKRRKKK